MLQQIARAFSDRGVVHALAGGVAMAAHGFPRATKDLDLLIAHSDADIAGEALRALGFEAASGATGFVRYVRHPLPELPELSEWADLLLARRPLGLELLRQAQAQPILWDGIAIPVVPREGIILMKLLAHVNDASRLIDRADIRALLGDVGQSGRESLRAAAAELGADVVALLHRIEQESHDGIRESPPGADFGL